MAELVLAGKADCPYYAKAERLADYLQKNLPHFRVHKITQHPDDWEQWLHDVCQKNGWKHTRSPIIWRELLDRGGKGMLVGGFNEFMEHAQMYYFKTSDMMTDVMLIIGQENLETHIEIQKEEEEFQREIKPLQVWIGSATASSYFSLIPLLTNGEVFGMDKEVSIHLLDSDDHKDDLLGVLLETEDLASPLLRDVTMHTNLEEAFHQADVVILLDKVHHKEDQSNEDFIRQTAEQYTEYGSLIENNAKEKVKVVVSGGTLVNLKTLLIINQMPLALQHNVIAVSMQLEGEAKAQLAKKLNVTSAVVKDVIVWGNISGVNFLDLYHTMVYHYDSAIWGPPNYSRPVLDLIYDSKWMQNDFTPEWIARRKHRRGMSTAHSVATVLRYWYQGSPPGEIVSLGVISEGQFGIPEGIVFSMPVTFLDGSWNVLSEIEVPDEIQEKLLEATSDLIKERDIVLPPEIPRSPPPEETSDLHTKEENDLSMEYENDLTLQESDIASLPSSNEPAWQDSFLPTAITVGQTAHQGSDISTQQHSDQAFQQDSTLPADEESSLPNEEVSSPPTELKRSLSATLEKDMES